MDIVTILIALVIVVAINCYFAKLMDEIATSKGHPTSKAFLLVFLFGVVGMLYVIALPDLHAREQQEDIIQLLLEIKQGKDE